MSYLAELHAAHKARIARMGGKAPKLERKVVPSTRDSDAQVEARPAPEPIAPVRATIPRSAQRSFLLARDIMRITCAAFNVQPYEILAKDRRVPLCYARQVVVYLMRKHSNLSWGKIGDFLGYDTSTVRHSGCKIRSMLESDPKLIAIVENIEREIAELPRE